MWRSEGLDPHLSDGFWILDPFGILRFPPGSNLCVALCTLSPFPPPFPFPTATMYVYETVPSLPTNTYSPDIPYCTPGMSSAPYTNASKPTHSLVQPAPSPATISYTSEIPFYPLHHPSHHSRCGSPASCANAPHPAPEPVQPALPIELLHHVAAFCDPATLRVLEGVSVAVREIGLISEFVSCLRICHLPAPVSHTVNAAFRTRCQYHWPDLHTRNLHQITTEVQPEALYIPLTPNVSILSPPSSSGLTNPEPPPPEPIVQSVWRRFYDLRSNPHPRFSRISFPSSSASTLDNTPSIPDQVHSIGVEQPGAGSVTQPTPRPPVDAPLPSSTETALAASTFVVAERMKIVCYHFRKMKGLLVKARSERQAEEAMRITMGQVSCPKIGSQ